MDWIRRRSRVWVRGLAFKVRIRRWIRGMGSSVGVVHDDVYIRLQRGCYKNYQLHALKETNRPGLRYIYIHL
jgi:hypothetical protein